MQQLNIFDFLTEKIKINKPVRLIELFAGYGSQSLALKYLGVPFEHHRICEWATKSIQAYNDLHIGDYTDYSCEFGNDEIIAKLFNYGISMDYNKPMTYDQIKRKGEKWCRQTYNNIIATHNLVNIQTAKAEDLDIKNTLDYTYIVTYSFPCQDLSLAGNMKGMSKGESTRSGMLWEVERLLKECKELPQILLMENVTQVHSKKNIDDLNAWIKSLEELGYTSFYEDMNAKNYAIPQNRNRTFMVSILNSFNNGNYTFPGGMQLEVRLKDFLEENVDEKYYLSEKMIQYISSNGTGGYSNADCKINLDVARPITTDPNKRAGTTNYLCNELPNNYDLKKVIKINENTKKGYAEAYEGDGVYTNRPHQKRGCVQKGMIQTIKTSCDDIGVVVRVGNYSPSGHNASSIVDVCGISPTVMENHGTVTAVVENQGEPICLNSKGGRNGIEGLQPSLQDRVYSSSSSVAITTSFHPSYTDKNDLRIRKLTPLECWKLMGVKEEDFKKVEVNQSNSSLYHLAGDSIVTTCLMAIFGKLLDVDYETKIKELVEELKK